MTLGRILDMSYRFNVGLLSLSVQRMKDFGDPENWVRKELYQGSLEK